MRYINAVFGGFYMYAEKMSVSINTTLLLHPRNISGFGYVVSSASSGAEQRVKDVGMFDLL